MAQISYTKLAIKPIDKIETIQWNKEALIEVKQYLPLEKKLEVLTTIIQNSGDGNGFYNSARLDFNIELEMLYAYTNIKFTDKQKEEPMKLYDAFHNSGLLDKIFALIPDSEFDWFNKHAKITIDKIYEYRNSVYGILDSLKTDYSDLDLDINKLRDSLINNEGIEYLREVTEKLG